MMLIVFSMSPSPATKELIPKRMDNIAATMYMIFLCEGCSRFDFLFSELRNLLIFVVLPKTDASIKSILTKMWVMR